MSKQALLRPCLSMCFPVPLPLPVCALCRLCAELEVLALRLSVSPCQGSAAVHDAPGEAARSWCCRSACFGGEGGWWGSAQVQIVWIWGSGWQGRQRRGADCMNLRLGGPGAAAARCRLYGSGAVGGRGSGHQSRERPAQRGVLCMKAPPGLASMSRRLCTVPSPLRTSWRKSSASWCMAMRYA